MQFESTELPGNIVRLSLSGRLDIEGTQSIEQKFSFSTTLSPERIIVDLSGVTFLASIGIRLLLTSARAQAAKGGKLVLAAPQPFVRKVLETAGIHQVVPIFPDLNTAQASIAG